ncbi:MAG: hypothetical protein GY862_36520 [Gammaproteobacteria bacterium]|nr:hypothetical protein [Gammaproteobacteria bacterium]
MHLSRLDNEVIFKKAFTDKLMFTQFVKCELARIPGFSDNEPGVFVLQAQRTASPKTA